MLLTQNENNTPTNTQDFVKIVEKVANEQFTEIESQIVGSPNQEFLIAGRKIYVTAFHNAIGWFINTVQPIVQEEPKKPEGLIYVP